MKNVIANSRLSQQIKRFGQERDGFASVEGAVVLSMLSILFIGMADLGAAAYNRAQMSSGLRFSAQYLMNEGTDLNVAEQIFRETFRSQGASFSTGISCSCAQYRSDLESGSANPMQQTSEDINQAVVDGGFAQCTISCGDNDPIKYLTITGSTDVHSLFRNGTTAIEDRVAVRVE